FGGLDGYWLLADGVREPDLRWRSGSACARVAARIAEGGRPAGEDLVLAGYAGANGCVAALLIASAIFFWYQLFGSVLAALVGAGRAGWSALGLAGLALFRPLMPAACKGLGVALTSARRASRRIKFRLEWRWRIPATSVLATAPELAGLDRRSLGVVAGQLRWVRTTAAHETSEPLDGLVLACSSGRPAIRRPAFPRTDPSEHRGPVRWVVLDRSALMPVVATVRRTG